MRIKRLHHVRFAARSLDQVERFATDFGLVTEQRTDARLCMRTSGGEACSYVAVAGAEDRFLGMAFETDDRASLDAAVARFGASPVEDLDLPGGGVAVAMTDPDGNQLMLVHGSEPRETGDGYPELVINTPFRKERFGRNQHPRDQGPARLWRLGHLALFVSDFARASSWYAERLGLIGSDIYHVPGMPDRRIVGFFRLDRGEEYVDHHILAFMQDDRGGCHHISFEAQDFEAQHRTHNFLTAQQHESIWGVGRHPHGSHVFDVWRAPDGARFETFSDTDLLQAAHGTKVHDIADIALDLWSGDGPERYFA